MLALLFVLFARTLVAAAASQPLDGVALHLGFLGDGGTGGQDQQAVARQLIAARGRGALDFVFLLGDNIYDSGESKYIRSKFLNVYQDLLDGGVIFHAALGNHDVRRCAILDVDGGPLPGDASAYEGCEVDQQLDPKNRFGYRDGRRYYRVPIDGSTRVASLQAPDAPGGESSGRTLIEVFVLDSNTLSTSQTLLRHDSDRAQLDWLQASLQKSGATWKIVTMHHPLHSPRASGWFSGHDREKRLAEELEPILTLHGVDVVFAGHNHFYARMVPQRGIRYFVAGGAGRGVYRYQSAEGYVIEEADRGKFHHFVHVRVTPDKFEYCTVDSEGRLRDGGWFRKGDSFDRPFPEGDCPF